MIFVIAEKNDICEELTKKKKHFDVYAQSISNQIQIFYASPFFDWVSKNLNSRLLFWQAINRNVTKVRIENLRNCHLQFF